MDNPCFLFSFYCHSMSSKNFWKQVLEFFNSFTIICLASTCYSWVNIRRSRLWSHSHSFYISGLSLCNHMIIGSSNEYFMFKSGRGLVGEGPPTPMSPLCHTLSHSRDIPSTVETSHFLQFLFRANFNWNNNEVTVNAVLYILSIIYFNKYLKTVL